MSTTFPLNLRATLGAVGQHLLPRRMKKLILFSSLTAVLRQDDTLDKQTLEKLNFVMGLASDVEAMKLPVYMRSSIWKGGAPIQITEAIFSRQSDKLQAVSTAVEQLLAKIPPSLRYAPEAQMKGDIEKYLTNARDYLDRRRTARA